jgi:hypothetical protein
MKESTFEGVGGLKIFTRSWQSEGKKRGVVVIVPGFNSHSTQYLWVGEQFAAKDLAAYASSHASGHILCRPRRCSSRRQERKQHQVGKVRRVCGQGQRRSRANARQR